MSKSLYLTPECQASWNEYETDKDFNKLEKCINLVDSTYIQNNLFGDNCVVLMRKAKKYYNKTYDESSAELLIKKVNELTHDDKKLNDDILNNLNKMFNLKRKTTTNLCDCVSISLYTMKNINFIEHGFGGKYDFEKLIMYLSSIYTSIITIKNNTEFIVRLYLDIGTLQLIFDLINKRGEFRYLNDYDFLGFNNPHKLNKKIETLENNKLIIKDIINSIFTCDIVEPYVMMCKNRMEDSNYIDGKLRLYRYSSFTDDTVRINASREADGCISLLDCHNLNLLSKKNLIIYNTTNTIDTYYWSDRQKDKCWVDLYNDYYSKYYETKITLDINSLVNNVIANKDIFLKRHLEETDLLTKIKKYKNLFEENKFAYNVKNIICSMWAGMVCFGFQLKEKKINKISEKINNVIDNLKNDINFMEREKIKNTNTAKNLNDSFELLFGVNYKNISDLIKNKIRYEDISYKKEGKHIVYYDNYSIPSKLEKYFTTLLNSEIYKYRTNYIRENLTKEELEVNGMISPMIISEEPQPGDSEEDLEWRRGYKKTNKLNKEVDKMIDGFTKCKKKEFIDLFNIFIDYHNANPELDSNLEKYYDSLHMIEFISNSLPQLNMNLHMLNAGFDEILLYEYFKNIILFYPNQNSIKKLLVLNSISFNYTYINRIIDVKEKYTLLYDELDENNKKIFDDVITSYSKIPPLLGKPIDSMIDYIELITKQKERLEGNKDIMIKYNSVMDILPYFNNYAIKDYFDRSDDFLKLYKLLTNTDFVENPVDKLVYNMYGGKVTNNDPYYSKYLKYKKKYLQQKNHK